MARTRRRRPGGAKGLPDKQSAKSHTENSKPDLMLRHLSRVIDRFRLQSFDNFINPHLLCSLHHAADAEPLLASDGEFVGYNVYEFDVWGIPLPQMRICPSGDGKIHVRHDADWLEIPDYLSLTIPSNPSSSGLSGAELVHHQYQWWRANGKFFRLLDLPAEIRESIYSMVFGSSILLPSRTKAFNLFATKVDGIRHGLLRVSKQVNREAEHVLYAHTVFQAESAMALESLLGNKVLAQRVQRLELTMPSGGFFEVFGLKTYNPPLITNWRRPRQVAEYLATLPLSELVLRVDGEHANDWARHADVVGGVCHRTRVDYILFAAWPLICALPVRLAGAVKTSQQEALQHACIGEHDRFRLWEVHQKAAFPGERVRITDYHEWVEALKYELDGGVSVAAGKRSAPPSVPRNKGNPFIVYHEKSAAVCTCSRPCDAKEWSKDD